jgi:hypothetical protein
MEMHTLQSVHGRMEQHGGWQMLRLYGSKVGKGEHHKDEPQRNGRP